jgi:hypothetical protein
MAFVVVILNATESAITMMMVPGMVKVARMRKGVNDRIG